MDKSRPFLSYSPKFALRGFSKVRVAPVLCRVVCLASLCAGYTYMRKTIPSEQQRSWDPPQGDGARDRDHFVEG